MQLEIVKVEDVHHFQTQIDATTLLNYEEYGVVTQPAVPLVITYSKAAQPSSSSTDATDEASTAPILGGLAARTFGSYLFVQLLWVSDEVRTGGVGSALMAKAEEEAKKRGCTMGLVETFSFQAEGFYVKLGYIPYARLPGGFEHKATRINFSKSLLR